MFDEGYKTIIKLLPDIVYRIDVNGIFCYINDSVSIIGYRPDELIGKHYSTILHPQDSDRVQREKILQHYNGKITTPEETPRLFDERRTGNRATRDLEVRLVKKDWNGKSESGIIHGRIISVGLYDSNDELNEPSFSGTVGMIRDITGIKKSEESIIRTEKHYRSLIENSTDVVTIIAVDGTILFEGPSIKRVLGYDPIERIGESLLQYVHKEDQPAFEKVLLKKSKGTKEVFYHQCRIATKEKGWMYFEFRGKRVFDNDAVLMCVILNSRDITEIKKKEQECHTHLAQTRAIINTATDAIIVFNRKGDILEVNPEAVKMYGYSYEEFLLKNCNSIGRDDDFFESCIESINDTDFFQSITEHTRTDGTKFYVDIRGRKIIYNNENNYLAIIRNITPLMTAQETLRQSEEKYRAIVDNSSDIIWIIDLNGKFTYISPAVEALRGYTPEEVLTMNVGNILSTKSAKYTLNRIRKELERDKSAETDSKQHLTMEVEALHKNGSACWSEISASFLRDPQGKPSGILGISRDIGERKKFEEQLKLAKDAAEESDHLKSAFLANMSHEIRTPMNSVIGYADLMYSASMSEEHKEYLNNIRTSGIHLLKIIDDILAISKIEAGQMKLEEIPFDIKSLLDDVKAQARILIAQSTKNISLRESISTNIARQCIGDPTRIKQVLLNFLSNAVKFTNEGFIEYGIKVLNDNFLEFYVRDTGIGIPEEFKSKIFKEFQQGDTGTMRKYGGTGLGLSISKSLVELMGGEIYLTSSLGEGHGSTFYFTLPYHPVEHSEILDTLQDFPVAEGEKYKVLVAEDNYLNQKLAKILLEKLGYNVVLASDGREAVSMFKSVPDIDLVLMDIQMPVLDGIEATRLIRNIEGSMDRMFNVPIVALTAHAMSSDMEVCFEAGCNDFITKPISQAILQATLKKHLK